MILVKNGHVSMEGYEEEIVKELSLIKLGMIDTIGEKQTEEIYKLANKKVNKAKELEINNLFRSFLPDELAKELEKIIKK